MLLARPGDATSLAKTIASLADNSYLRQKLSVGAKRLGSRFEWFQIASKTARLYQQVMDYE
jgi:glycosyltransferase involved in cell wall biosynthesis